MKEEKKNIVLEVKNVIHKKDSPKKDEIKKEVTDGKTGKLSRT